MKAPEKLLKEIQTAISQCYLHPVDADKLEPLLAEIDQVCGEDKEEPVLHCINCGEVKAQLCVDGQCDLIDITIYPAWKWLKPLPIWIRGMAVRNCLNVKNEYRGLDTEWLSLAFNWSYPPEGYLFWINIFQGNYAEAEKILKEQGK